MKQGLDLILPKLAKVISNLSQFAMQYKDLPTLGYTHHQVAQPITVGKRAAQWTQDLVMDLEDIELVREALLLRGAQGTTGTQASFMEIFHGDGEKIDQLNEKLCEVSFPTCTYTHAARMPSLYRHKPPRLGVRSHGISNTCDRKPASAASTPSPPRPTPARSTCASPTPSPPSAPLPSASPATSATLLT